MAILLIIHNWLELDMPNVLMLDGKSYIGSHLSVSTYLRSYLDKAKLIALLRLCMHCCFVGINLLHVL